jgi:hypothetical protein
LSSYTGTALVLVTICIWKTLEIFRMIMYHLQYDKTGVTPFCFSGWDSCLLHAGLLTFSVVVANYTSVYSQSLWSYWLPILCESKMYLYWPVAWSVWRLCTIHISVDCDRLVGVKIWFILQHPGTVDHRSLRASVEFRQEFYFGILWFWSLSGPECKSVTWRVVLSFVLIDREVALTSTPTRKLPLWIH